MIQLTEKEARELINNVLFYKEDHIIKSFEITLKRVKYLKCLTDKIYENWKEKGYIKKFKSKENLTSFKNILPKLKPQYIKEL
jgi:hypothetical protein